MEKNIYILKKAFNCRIIFIILIVIGSPIVKAEGTKEFRPDSTEYGDMQINDMEGHLPWNQIQTLFIAYISTLAIILMKRFIWI